ncbi:spermidine/putrescine ABC transporter permease [Candidatus Epulonipiscium fishelsonii]|uniref:Spermidine/putrescine ABC transporter permease n=1 Tax=Candidatus Epulonipiscium fishelsonii TaxID=77094 RepID=A0ACC8XEN3_9FIRM|nr:spermidine/putrescine ABC transporter permease [Epulopiscium sp. SCG-B05WGA-EpuloA1]ONI41489.1 spermidine/putrescine ABC transporter permease [Epulopiscium sp. SCG-B11WGA-EpuloA1]
MIKILKKAYLGIIILIIYAPIVLLMAFSFNDSKTTSWQGFTLQWYFDLFKDYQIKQSFEYTVTVAVVSTICSVIIGTLAAIGINQMTEWKRNIVMSVTYIPLLSPDIVTGISLMMLYSTLHIPFGLITLILSHITFSVPYVILSVMPRLRTMNPNIYEAALDLGATPFYAFKHVILPEILPGVISGAFIAFTLSLDDFVVSFFNTASGVTTLSIQIYSMARKGVNPKINAISTIVFVTILIILIINNMRANKKFKENAK